MGHKKRSKRDRKKSHSNNSKPLPQQSASSSTVQQSSSPPEMNHSPKSSSSMSSAAGDGQEEQAILAECEKALNEFQSGDRNEGFELIKNTVAAYPAAGLPYRIAAFICEYSYNHGISITADQRAFYLEAGLQSALRAVELSPSSIEYVLFYVNLFLYNSSIRLADYKNLHNLCEDALSVEHPVDIPATCMTILGCYPIPVVQRELRNLQRNFIERIESLEKRRKEIELAVAAARLEQQNTLSTSLEAGASSSQSADQNKDLNKETDDTAAVRQEQKPEKARKARKRGKKKKKKKEGTSTSGPADLKTVTNDEIPDPVTRDEQRKVAEHIVPGVKPDQKSDSTSHDAGKAHSLESTPVDQKKASNKELPNSATQNEQSKEAEVTSEATKLEQKTDSTSYDVSQAQKHSNTPTSTTTLDAPDQKKASNKELSNSATQNEQMEEANPIVGAAKLERKSEAEHGHTSESTSACSEPADQKAAKTQQLPDWIPPDDGIVINIPGMPSLSREEILEYFYQRLYGHSTESRRLSVFKILTDLDVPRSSNGSLPANK